MKTVIASVAVITAALSFTAGSYAATGDPDSTATSRHPLTAAGPRDVPVRNLPAPPR